jgi:uncharacterized protein YlxW (UPF0749 family)
VIIKIDDSPKTPATEDSIVHAADLRDIINLLWASGAEGIAVNDQRIVLGTAVDCIVNTILINNVRIAAPFQIEALGDQPKMSEAIQNANTVANLHLRQKNLGLVFTSNKNNDITLPIFNGSFDINTGQY